jgi:DNA-binding FrmR family transcriptional regulator
MSTFITRMLENEEWSRTVLAAVAAATGLLALLATAIAQFVIRP